MSYVVIDTDVASAILKGRLPNGLARRLAGQQLAITFVTVGELTQWTLPAPLGTTAPGRPAGLLRQRRRSALTSFQVATVWGEIQAHARLRGRPRPINDCWVAACCLARELPLATFNIKDYADFAEHEGLELVR